MKHVPTSSRRHVLPLILICVAPAASAQDIDLDALALRLNQTRTAAAEPSAASTARQLDQVPEITAQPRTAPLRRLPADHEELRAFAEAHLKRVDDDKEGLLTRSCNLIAELYLALMPDQTRLCTSRKEQ